MSKARFIETANHIYPTTSCLPKHRFRAGGGGRVPDAYHYSYPPVLLLLTTPLALMAPVPADCSAC